MQRPNTYVSVAKSQRDPAKRKEYRIMAAQFSRVVKAFDQGQDVDLSQMPGPPPGYKSSYNLDVSKFVPQQKTAVATPAQSAPPPAAKPPQPEGEEEYGVIIVESIFIRPMQCWLGMAITPMLIDLHRITIATASLSCKAITRHLSSELI